MCFRSSTELFSTSTGFSSALALPYDTRSHNLLSINDTHAILLGGTENPTGTVWVIDTFSKVWRQLSSLNKPKQLSQAGVVTKKDGSRMVIIAGSANDNSTEILNLEEPLEEQVWTFGPDLPYELQGGASVQYEDTFIIVGGLSSRRTDQIIKFDVKTEDWIILPQHLQAPRDIFTAFLIPDSYIECT